MRVLPLCMLVLALAGCSTQHTAPPTTESISTQAPATQVKAEPAARQAPATLYRNAEELVGKPFRDLGEVAGSVCQLSIQDPPPNLATARRQMQVRASQMKANAVLLHDCQMIRGLAGCYQQGICQGSALNVSHK
ncbi:Rcs stress response system protein RcsF [Serratia sp. UGAL515B_01]|uniref:Rcs stress response system protein RcsF n=1 Tax=Serratia sp. UGAL515B_01 TaxID=2986763 RepID=UPI0029550B7E|nr:Rcs stress response system protein RcsF [Serratia sp. UGAL515B_01]WON75961.1 Rcs stress response system protein RcsF [Serratia sp. UGAL515B_01]